MKNVLILEDNRESNKFLSDILAECRGNITIYAAFDEREALQLAMDCSIDLFLIDISLHAKRGKDFSGFTFAKRIRKIDRYEVSPIIFVTSVANLELLTYREVSCFNYILKPINSDKKKQIIHQVETLLKGNKGGKADDFYYFKIDNVYHPIKIADILTITCEKRRLFIQTLTDSFYVSRLPMKQLMKELDRIGNNPFVECHRGVLINLDYVEHIDTVNKYLKMQYKEEKVDFGNSKWLTRVQGVIHYDK